MAVVAHAIPRLPTPEDGCGRSTTAKTRIVGGTVAQDSELI